MTPGITSPFKGLTPYLEEDAPLFFGREAEIEIIAANLLASNLTLLYGPSGVGKSSVLRAGVVHHLHQLGREVGADRGAPPFIVAVFSAWRDDPLSGLLGSIKTAISDALQDQTLKPVPRTHNLVEALQALLQGVDSQLLVILDQFEEYFLYHPYDEGQGTFAFEFPRLINHLDLRANFLISTREDSLAKLDRFKGRIPNLFDNYLRLEHLERRDARDAISKPITYYNQTRASPGEEVEIEPDLVDAVLDQVQTGQVVLGEVGRGVAGASMSPTEGRIETPFLQLVMTRIWDAEMRAGSKVLRLETLRSLGGAERIVRTHLDAALDDLDDQEQEIIARVFHHLVTPGGTKVAHTASDLAGYAELPEEQLTPILEKLSRSEVRILRPVAPPPDRPKTPRYEIFHDVLSPSILDWRARRVQAQEQARAEQELWHERRRVNRLRLGVVGLGALLLLMVCLAAFAYGQTRVAQSARDAAVAAQATAVAERDRSTSRELAASAIRSLGMDPERSTLLALEAMHLDRTAQAEDALHQAVQALRVRQILTEHEGSVTSVDFSPDGTRLATASTDRTAIVWDAASGTRLFTLEGHTSWVREVAYSPDGLLIATASDDQTVKLWDAATGEELRTLTGHERAVDDLAFSPDSRLLATASWDSLAKVWDVASGRELFSLEGHAERVNGVAFSPDGNQLVTGSDDHLAKVWDLLTGEEVRTLRGHDQEIFNVTYYQNGAYIATASRDNTIRFWRADSGDLASTLLVHTNTVFDLDESGDLLASASADGTAIIWSNPFLGQFIRLPGHTNTLVGVAISPDQKRAATASWDGTARIWDIAPSRELLTLEGHTASVNSVVFSPDGSRLATAANDFSVRVWEADSGREVLTLPGHSNEVLDLAYSPDGSRLASVTWKQIHLWDASSGEELLTIEGHEDWIQGVAFSPDGTRLVTAGSDRVGHVWDALTGEQLLTLTGHTEGIREVAYSPDGRWVATAGEDELAILWDAATGELVRNLAGHTERLFDLAFSPDSTRLVTASEDESAVIWDVESGEPLFRLIGHPDTLLGVAYSPDGARIATASKDRTTKVWDARTGEELLTLVGHSGDVNELDFDPSGRHLATAGADQVVRLYTLDVDELMDVAHNRLTRTLSEEECQRYLFSEQCPPGVVAIGLLVEGQNQAMAGDMEAAAASFTEAMSLYPSLGIDPEERARALATESAVEVARNLALAGDVEGATARFQEALALDASLAIDPQAEASRLAAMGRLATGERYVAQGWVTRALEAYGEAQEIDPSLTISATSWNRLCWFGSLWGYAGQVMDACEQAVSLAPSSGAIRDSRGLARALTGDYEGAIEDFRYFVDWGREADVSLELLLKRLAWIDQLEAGRSPFTEAVLEDLRFE